MIVPNLKTILLYNSPFIFVCIWLILVASYVINYYTNKRLWLSKNLYLFSISCLTIACTELSLIPFIGIKFINLRSMWVLLLSIILGIWCIPTMPILGYICVLIPLFTIMSWLMYHKSRQRKTIKISYDKKEDYDAFLGKDLSTKAEKICSYSQNFGTTCTFLHENKLLLQFSRSEEDLKTTINNWFNASILGIGPTIYNAHINLEKSLYTMCNGYIIIEAFNGIPLSVYIQKMVTAVITNKKTLDDVIDKFREIDNKIQKDCFIARLNGIFIDFIRPENVQCKSDTDNPVAKDFYIVKWSPSVDINVPGISRIYTPGCYDINFTNEFINEYKTKLNQYGL